MKFRIEIWNIAEIIKSYEDKILDLNPPYQRRFIWALSDQQTLITSILQGYAIPNIFLYERKKGMFEMVDGQQRTRTIIGFYDKQFRTENGEWYNEKQFGENFLSYEIPVTVIEKIEADESIDWFYVLVNKSGVHLNRPELKKAEFFDTNFLKLVTELADLDIFQDLALFSEASAKRMNDIDFVSELVTYLQEGNTDKKIKVDRAFEKDITNGEYKDLEDRFVSIMKIITKYNNRYPISKTRYKQRNDFYTLFGFVSQNLSLTSSTLNYFYDLLLRFNDDINPSNDKCEPFQIYAFHCISQSNSKNARDERSKIFNELFLNPKKVLNKSQKSVVKFYRLKETDMVQVSGYLTFDLSKLI